MCQYIGLQMNQMYILKSEREMNVKWKHAHEICIPWMNECLTAHQHLRLFSAYNYVDLWQVQKYMFPDKNDNVQVLVE